MTRLEARDVCKRYGDRAILDRISFAVDAGSIVSLLGRSGSGKSTLLRLIAGLARVDSGHIAIDGKVHDDGSNASAPERRGVAMVFQHDALWPHMTAIEHLRFASRDSLDATELRGIVESTHLAGFENRRPDSLSGGERQRLSLARALASRPRVILFDEPTRNLDRPLAREVRRDVCAVLRTTHTAAVFVTHDPEEALAVGDRLMVLHRGSIVADDAPEVLFERPRNEATAALLHTGESFAIVAAGGGRALTPFGAVAFDAPAGTRGVAFIRGDDLAVAADGTRARVVARRCVGIEREVELDAGGSRITLRMLANAAPPIGAELAVRFGRDPLVYRSDAP